MLLGNGLLVCWTKRGRSVKMAGLGQSLLNHPANSKTNNKHLTSSQIFEQVVMFGDP